MHPPHHNHDPELAPGCSSMDSETQVYRTSENRTDQARKERLLRQLNLAPPADSKGGAQYSVSANNFWRASRRQCP
jgi:hypothetical protein